MEVLEKRCSFDIFEKGRYTFMERRLYHKIISKASAKYSLKFLNDEQYIKLVYWGRLGSKINLKNPETFNEKMQWLKLHDRKQIYANMVDKYAVKSHVASIIGKEYLIPTLGIWDSFDEINFTQLPNQFVLKCTHDSGGIVICTDESKLDKAVAKEKIENSLKRNYFYYGREWPYKGVKPKIIAEKYMTDESGSELKDYKMFIFSGKLRCIQVDYDRFTDHHRNFYNTDWKYLPFTTCYPTNSEKKIYKPKCLKDMMYCAERLADSVGNPPFLRVDMYAIQGKPYFGEMTFYHGGGFEIFYPENWDYKLGNWLKINNELN